MQKLPDVTKQVVVIFGLTNKLANERNKIMSNEAKYTFIYNAFKI